MQTLRERMTSARGIVNKSIYKIELVNDQSENTESFLPQQPNKNLEKRSSCGLSQIARFLDQICWWLDKFITDHPPSTSHVRRRSIHLIPVVLSSWEGCTVSERNSIDAQWAFTLFRASRMSTNGTRLWISIRITLIGLLCRERKLQLPLNSFPWRN